MCFQLVHAGQLWIQKECILLGFWWWWWIHPPLVLESYDGPIPNPPCFSLVFPLFIITCEKWLYCPKLQPTHQIMNLVHQTFSFLFFFLFGFQSLPFGMSHWDAFRSPGWYRNLAYAWHTLKNFQVFNSVQTTGSSTVPLYLMLDGRDWLRAIRLVTLVLRATKNYVRLLQFGDLYLSINRLGPCCGANVLENQFTNYLKIFIIYLFRNVIIYEVLFGLVFHTVANRLKLGNLSLHFHVWSAGENANEIKYGGKVKEIKSKRK